MGCRVERSGRQSAHTHTRFSRARFFQKASEKSKKGKEESHLPTPTHAQAAPLLDTRRLLLNLLYKLRHLLRRIRRARRTPEERPQPFFLLLRVRRIGAAREGFPEEEVGHEDLVAVLGVRVGEDVGALECLRGEAEDVVDDEDGGGGGGGAGGVALGAVEGDVFAFFFVVFGDGGRDVAAGFAVALLGFHGLNDFGDECGGVNGGF